MGGIKYVSPESTKLTIRRFNFENRLARIEKKFATQKKPNVADETVALMEKYRYLTEKK